MKTTVHAILFVVVALVVLISAIGILSAPEYEGVISKTFNADSKTIWNILSDTEAYSLSRHEVKSVKILPTDETGRKKWIENTGYTGNIYLEIAGEEHEQYMEVNMIKSDFGMRGTWKFIFQQIDDNITKVVITEKSVTEGFLMRTILSIVGRDGNLKLQMKAIEKNINLYKDGKLLTTRK